VKAAAAWRLRREGRGTEYSRQRFANSIAASLRRYRGGKSGEGVEQSRLIGRPSGRRWRVAVERVADDRG
jgi:hypothetical protein